RCDRPRRLPRLGPACAAPSPGRGRRDRHVRDRGSTMGHSARAAIFAALIGASSGYESVVERLRGPAPTVSAAPATRREAPRVPEPTPARARPAAQPSWASVFTPFLAALLAVGIVAGALSWAGVLEVALAPSRREPRLRPTYSCTERPVAAI